MMQQQQQGEGRDNQNQERRLKTMQGGGENQHHHQPQKCPRCDSLNTKFCYYNNYSLSQPRYFCKTCRRYWTQGGTLRNVPVGGGCRKGKRAKASSSSASSSSSESSRSHSNNMIISANTSNSGNTANPAVLRTKELADLVSPSPAISSMGPYYSAVTAVGSGGGGFLGSLAAIQSMNNQPVVTAPQSSFSLNLPVNLGGDMGGPGPSNLSLLHGFSSIPSFGSQQQQQILQQRQLFQMGILRDAKTTPELSFYHAPPHHHQQQQNQQNWSNHQAFFSNANPSTVSDSLWSISTCTQTTTTTTTPTTNRVTTATTTTTSGGSFSLNPGDSWHDLPSYGPTP